MKAFVRTFGWISIAVALLLFPRLPRQALSGRYGSISSRGMCR